MAQSGYSPILIYGSTTASNTPSAGNLTTGSTGVELAINATDGKLFYKDNAGVVQVLATKAATSGQFGSITATSDSFFTSTGALQISKGTTAQQPGTPATGMIRYNSTSNQFEGYSGASPAWKSIGGSALSNDTTTATNLYPVFAAATTGTAENLYTSNAQYLYKPSTGELSVQAPVASNGIFVNSTTVSASYTIAAGYNGHSIGPITVNSGVSVTVTSGQQWIVI